MSKLYLCFSCVFQILCVVHVHNRMSCFLLLNAWRKVRTVGLAASFATSQLPTLFIHCTCSSGSYVHVVLTVHVSVGIWIYSERVVTFIGPLSWISSILRNYCSWQFHLGKLICYCSIRLSTVVFIAIVYPLPMSTPEEVEKSVSTFCKRRSVSCASITQLRTRSQTLRD